MGRLVQDPREAERLVSEVYLPNRLVLGRAPTPLAMALPHTRVGSMTVGRLSYGREVRTVTPDPEHFHINLPVRGRAASRAGADDLVPAGPGQGIVFGTEASTEIVWSEDCEQLCLMVPRAKLESALEGLLDDRLGDPLRMKFLLDMRIGPGRLWRSAVHLLLEELALPEHARGPVTARHLEALVLDRLLLAQPHNYSEALRRTPRINSGPVVRKAVELMEERPGEAWTIVELAAAVHVSVRSLQQRFQEQLGVSPMTYLRQVRLRRVRELLLDPPDTDTTVRSVAERLGFLHLGRFATLYRNTYGEAPSTTLRRAREEQDEFGTFDVRPSDGRGSPVRLVIPR